MIVHVALYIAALTSVDKGSFLDMLSNKSANEKSSKKVAKVIMKNCVLYIDHFKTVYTSS